MTELAFFGEANGRKEKRRDFPHEQETNGRTEVWVWCHHAQSPNDVAPKTSTSRLYFSGCPLHFDECGNIFDGSSESFR